MLTVAIVTDRALLDPRLNDASFRLLVLLSHLARADGWCHTTHAQLAALLDRGDAAIARALRQLVALGHIVVDRVRGAHAHTRYLLPDLLHAKTPACTVALVARSVPWDNGRPPETVREERIISTMEKPVTMPTVAARTTAPTAFPLDSRHLLFAKERGIDRDRAEEETELFLDFHRARGSLMADWTAAWRTWMRKVTLYDDRYGAAAPFGQHDRRGFRSFNQRREDQCHAELQLFAGQQSPGG